MDRRSGAARDRLARTILSTDDEEIAKVGRAAGLETPFLRPAELAQDTTPTLPVLQHAVGYARGTAIATMRCCLLQPTNPLRTAEMIDACIARFEATAAATRLISVSAGAARAQPALGLLRERRRRAPPRDRRGRADPAPPGAAAAYHREGSIYVMRRDV